MDKGPDKDSWSRYYLEQEHIGLIVVSLGVRIYFITNQNALIFSILYPFAPRRWNVFRVRRLSSIIYNKTGTGKSNIFQIKSKFSHHMSSLEGRADQFKHGVQCSNLLNLYSILCKTSFPIRSHISDTLFLCHMVEESYKISCMFKIDLHMIY